MVCSKKNGSNARILNSVESGCIAVVSPGMKMECMSVGCAMLHSLDLHVHVHVLYAWWLISVIVYCVINTSVYLNLLSLCLFEFIFQLFLKIVVHTVLNSLMHIECYILLTCIFVDACRMCLYIKHSTHML